MRTRQGRRVDVALVRAIKRTLRLVTTDPRGGPDWEPVERLPVESPTAWLSHLREGLRAWEGKLRAKRLSQWRCQMVDDPPAAYQHVRRRVGLPLPVGISKDGEVETDPGTQAALIGAFWEGFYQADEGQGRPGDLDGGDVLPELTGEGLRSAAQWTGKKSGPGPEGMSISDLRFMPAQGWDALAQVLRRVEDGDPWPDWVVRARVVSLPKAEGEANYFPISRWMGTCRSE